LPSASASCSLRKPSTVLACTSTCQQNERLRDVTTCEKKWQWRGLVWQCGTLQKENSKKMYEHSQGESSSSRRNAATMGPKKKKKRLRDRRRRVTKARSFFKRDDFIQRLRFLTFPSLISFFKKYFLKYV
jgi:hypothetical protein